MDNFNNSVPRTFDNGNFVYFVKPNEISNPVIYDQNQIIPINTTNIIQPQYPIMTTTPIVQENTDINNSNKYVILVQPVPPVQPNITDFSINSIVQIPEQNLTNIISTCHENLNDNTTIIGNPGIEQIQQVAPVEEVSFPEEIIQSQPNEDLFSNQEDDPVGSDSENQNQVIIPDDVGVDADPDDDFEEDNDEEVDDEDDNNEEEPVEDEKIKEPCKKQRRRILIPAEEDEVDPDERNEILQYASDNDTAKNTNLPSPSEFEAENENPKPKCKKESTKKFKEMQARLLLQNAVLIQADDKKKKKIRVIDSDEDDVPVVDTVEDIGIENENSFVIDTKNILFLKEDVETVLLPQEIEGNSQITEDLDQKQYKRKRKTNDSDSSSSESLSEEYKTTETVPSVSTVKQPVIIPSPAPKVTSIPAPSRVTFTTGNVYKTRRKSSEESFTSSDSESESNSYITQYPREKKVTKNFSKTKKRDRFYDRSRDIPDDIYFSNVPLNVLYSYDKSTSSESDDGRYERVDNYRGRTKSIYRNTSTKKVVSKKSRYSSGNGRNRNKKRINDLIELDEVDTATETPITYLNRLKEYFKLAGLSREMSLVKLLKGCISYKERADKILNFLHKKGLEGDPTVYKCRELKKQLQIERESRELATSAIIETNGRTRSSTRNQLRKNEKIDAVETIGTLQKLKKLIDSDSDESYD